MCECIYVCVCLYKCMLVHVYMCMCMCMCVCMYIFVACEYMCVVMSELNKWVEILIFNRIYGKRFVLVLF